MPIEISDWNDLDGVRNDLTADYVLVNDLDSETDGYDGIGDDFERLGVVALDGDAFTGSFDGDGFAIKDFVLGDDGRTDRGHGLFGGLSGATVENLSVSGTVDLTGFAIESRAGGITGDLRDNSTIQNCVSHVDVTSDGDQVGGLVGLNLATVTDSYATGSVEGDERVGGLVGQNNDTVQTSYAVGLVTGNEKVGGLAGAEDRGTTTDSYWDTENTEQSTSASGTGLTTDEMTGDDAETNMDGFDFVDIWETVE